MDSGNSGSVSSSGDEEYDSHAEPSFLNHPTTHFGSMFDPSSSYLHVLSQSQPNPNPHSFESQAQRSELNCTLPNQCLSGPQHFIQDNNINATQLSSPAPTNNVVRNSKKRSRASRRAPTTVLTTDTTNFRSMVQEFTGIPAPPFPSSSSSYSRRLPLRSNPLLSTPRSTLLHNNINISSSSATPTTNNSLSSNNNQLLPPHLSLPHHNTMLSMQNHPILAFHPSPLVPAGFGAKSLSMPSLHDDVGVISHGQLNAHLVTTTNGGASGMPLRSASDDGCRDGGGRRDPFRSFDGNYGSCKLNISASASSSLLYHEKTLENGSPRGEGTTGVDSWICSSDQ